jgi:hypothetical protein
MRLICQYFAGNKLLFLILRGNSQGFVYFYYLHLYASDSEKLNAAIAGADTLQAAISLFKNIPAIGIGVSLVDIDNK